MMEASGSHSAHIIEINREIHARKPTQLGNKSCGGAATCGFSDSASGGSNAEERQASMKKLWRVAVLCIIFMAIEVVGGIKANSLAILTDAAHLLSDVTAFGISLFSLWASGWEATPQQSYGFFRIEILGTLVSIQLIWLLTGILVFEAIHRIVHDSGDVEGSLMFAVAFFGLIVNIIMALVLGHDHGHGHGHGGHGHGSGGHGHVHDHDHGRIVNMHHDLGHSVHEEKNHTKHCGVDTQNGEGKHNGEQGRQGMRDCHSKNIEVHSVHGEEHKAEHHNHAKEHGHSKHKHEAQSKGSPVDDDQLNKRLLSHSEDSCADTVHNSVSTGKSKRWNINVQGAYLHVLGDTIQSIGVMIGGAIIWWKPEWRIIDLLCTLFFSLIVLATTIKMLRNILEVLMESTPREIDARRLEEGLCEMEEVEAVHELHIWAITVGKVLLACHVEIKPDADADQVLDNVIGYIQREYNISHVTIQIERSTAHSQ
ncbi:metal tolerance protein A2-like isoform X2 [Nymphaea colorata]|nr:metal tolerance protein A2-like isoform X1 [Nymphaea colorata]XP_031497160.1 metal tolerance protein A2-like isoform X2 [Nymphaea colorata]